MNANDATKTIEQAIESLKAAADAIASGLPAVRKELVSAAELRTNFDAVSRTLAEANAQLGTAAKALDSIEASLIASMDEAMNIVHDKTHSVETRKALLHLCQQAYTKLAAAGFNINIPSIGQPIDTRIHTPKGKAKSIHGDNVIADVIRWGYSFPSGQGRLAEVLAGDGSLSEESEKAAKPSQPSSKAGISMVLDEDEAGQGKHKKAKPTTLFEQLAEAAERNQE